MVGPLQTPIDYFGQLAPFDIGQAMQSHALQNQQQATAQAAQQRAVQQQAALDAARQAAIANPSAAAFNKLLVLDPQSHEAIKTAWGLKDESQRKADLQEITAIDGLLAAGRHDEALARVQRRRDADAKAGLPTDDDDEMIDTIKTDPQSARLYTGSILAGILGDKAPEVIKTVGEERRADAELPGKIALTTAQTDSAEANAIKTNVEAREIPRVNTANIQTQQAQRERWRRQSDIEAERLALDKDALQTNTQLELEKLASKGTELSAGAEGRLSAAVVNAEGSRQLATRASDLAAKIEAAPIGLGGVFASVNEAARGTFGTQNPITALRKEYSTLINAQATANLPPGPASDKDIKLAREGFPKSNANAETMASFLRGMAKLQTIKANREQARADWISENGNEGRARKDIMVNGVRVPAGTTFGEFSQSAASVERRQDVAERPYMQKYK